MLRRGRRLQRTPLVHAGPATAGRPAAQSSREAGAAAGGGAVVTCALNSSSTEMGWEEGPALAADAAAGGSAAATGAASSLTGSAAPLLVLVAAPSAVLPLRGHGRGRVLLAAHGWRGCMQLHAVHTRPLPRACPVAARSSPWGGSLWLHPPHATVRAAQRSAWALLGRPEGSPQAAGSGQGLRCQQSGNHGVGRLLCRPRRAPVCWRARARTEPCNLNPSWPGDPCPAMASMLDGNERDRAGAHAALQLPCDSPARGSCRRQRALAQTAAAGTHRLADQAEQAVTPLIARGGADPRSIAAVPLGCAIDGAGIGLALPISLPADAAC